MKAARRGLLACVLAAACSAERSPADPESTSATAPAVAAGAAGTADTAAHGGQHAGAGGAGMAAMTPSPGDTEATRGYKAAMHGMMTSAPAYVGDPDVDFMKQMRVHHLAAIRMAEVELQAGKDARARALAQAIIDEQQREIGIIDAWLRERGAA